MSDLWSILTGDSLSILKKLPKSSIQSVVTSPPYYQLRDYNSDNQIGQEISPQEYIDRIVDIFKEVKRVLRRDGSCWINIGEKYAVKDTYKSMDIKTTDLMLLPWRLADALQKDRWHIRQMIPWVKPNSLPEHVSCRPNNSLEYVILISKNRKFYFDMESAKSCMGIKRNWRNGDSLLFMDVPTERTTHNHPAPMPTKLAEVMIKASTSEKGCCKDCGTPLKRKIKTQSIGGDKTLKGKSQTYYGGTSKNSITSLSSNLSASQKYTVVETLGWEKQCNCQTTNITKQTILDPFSGSGTTGIVSLSNGHKYIGIELNKDFAEESKKRLQECENKMSEDIFNQVDDQNSQQNPS